MQNPQQSGQSGQKPFGQQNQQKDQSQKNQQPQVNKTSPWATPAQPQAPKVMTPITPAPAAPCNTGRMFLLGIIIGMAIVWVWNDTHRGAKGDSALTGGQEEFATSTADGSTVNVSGATGGTPDAASLSAGYDTSKDPAGVQSQDAIQVADTQAAGDTVAVDGIAATEPMWAVVYEYNDGAIGRVLGATRFTPDQTTGTVTLVRSTLPGLKYFVGLVANTADNTYVVHQNAPLVDADGKQIGAAFTAQ